MGWREASSGPASYGYYRGSPLYRGQGAGGGPAVSGTGKYAQGQGVTTSATGQWSPTIVYLLVLVLAEMFIFGYLARKI